MTTVMAWFVKMMIYCAKVVDLEWQIMLQKGFFIFFAQKTHFCIFLSGTNGLFVKNLPKFSLIFVPTQFTKILDHFISTFHLLVECETFYSIFVFLAIFCRFSWKRSQVKLQVLYSLFMIFGKKLLLDTQVVILIEIH
jgi:hypothetical protein